MLESNKSSFGCLELDRTCWDNNNTNSDVSCTERISCFIVLRRNVAINSRNSFEFKAHDLRSLGFDLETMSLEDCRIGLNSSPSTASAPAGASQLTRQGLVPGQSVMVPMYLLGRELVTSNAPRAEDGGLVFAIDITSYTDHVLVKDLEVNDKLVDLRQLAMQLHQRGDNSKAQTLLGRAGLAVALASWHASHQYCPQCGSRTVPTQAGSRRQCQQGHKQYPLVTPVVIVLVESKCGSKILLGRSKKMPPHMLTCLSGFLDMGETLAEGCAREVLEESGIHIDLHTVEIVGSQPWPIGRGGSHEIMVGCVAKACSESIAINQDEMDTVQWVDMHTLQQALSGKASFNIPPPIAIAHQLITSWMQSSSRSSSL